MENEVFENLRLELRRGTLTLAVLAQLRIEHYGYNLRKALADQGLAIDENTLYPLLRRLEAQGLLTSLWREEEKRNKRFYRLSPPGEIVLYQLLNEHEAMNAALERIVTGRIVSGRNTAVSSPLDVDSALARNKVPALSRTPEKGITMKLTHDTLLNRYLQAVGFWLPRSQKDDILAELSEDLRLQIEDREAGLQRRLNDAEVSAILKHRGQPMLVANSFLPQQSLIGPVLYPIYIFVLKMVSLCYLVPWLLIWIALGIFDHAQTTIHLPHHPLGDLGTLWTIAFTQFGAITLIFALMDRYASNSIQQKSWDPAKLPKVRLPRAAKRRVNAVAGLVFGILGFAWLLAVPNYPFLLIGPATYAVKAGAVWGTVYPLFLILAVAGMVESTVVLARPDLNGFQPTFKVATSILSLWIVYRLLQTRTYVVATGAYGSHYVAAVNVIVQIGVLCAALGIAIALCVHVWQAVRELSRPMRPTATRLA